jgi:two-component system sensor histidine kinase MtrB
MTRLRPRGLRGRIAITFGTGALLISGALATSTFLFSRAYLYHQREATAVRQASLDAIFVSDQLDNADADIPEILSAAGPPNSGTIVVERGGQWYSSSLGVGREVIPEALAERVRRGQPARVTLTLDGLPTVIVGIPLPRPDEDFYRIVPMRELHETIRILGIVLAAGAGAAAAGGIVTGIWASRRVVAPLNLVASTAAQVAGGLLDTRLPPTDDPDLATIVGSFNAMVDTLKQRIERDSRFAADVSHELRSPLTTLVAAVDVMEGRRTEVPEKVQRARDLVHAELDRFQQLLDSLLTLARAEAGLDPEQLRPVPLAPLVEHALTRAGLSPQILLASGPGVVEGDKAMLERAFFNLIDNAKRHGQGLTEIRLDEAGGRVVTVIDDSGPGVPAAERERIFERFATNRAARGSSSGTGLGLALVAESVTAHGGTVWCTSYERPGARFVVSLPAYVDRIA